MSSTLFWAFGVLSAAFLNAIPCLGFNCADHPLKPNLSSEAAIYLPGSEGFINATTRWSAVIAPGFDVVVKVATEEDVQQTIRYANEHKKPFLAVSGSHGTASTLNNVKNGVGIWTSGLRNISIVDDGKAALIEGGVINGDLIPFLWDHGKQTVTTGCDCVGYIPPILGGGHGWLQGRYGLAADQLISARVVLANGTALTVSDTENPDLFWGIRGAGHNFGVVTQVKMKIYDREPEQDEWAASGFVYTQDKMEKVFEIANQWLESPNRPVELIHYGLFAFNPDVDPDKPSVIFWVYWQGASIPAEYADPLQALEPIAVDSSVTNLADVNTHLMATRGGAACAKGSSRLMYPISLKVWSVTNLRTILDILADVPAEYRTSAVMLEAYSTNRVGEIEDGSTAFPDRDGQLLAAPLLAYPANASLDATAFEIGEKIRAAFLKDTGLPLEAYVNYARGDETLEEVYGHEPWRLEKLRRLKKEFDPLGQFNFFAPIS